MRELLDLFVVRVPEPERIREGVDRRLLAGQPGSKFMTESVLTSPLSTWVQSIGHS